MYGKDIGRKFYEDGSVRRYPGNTVVADVTPESAAYEVMLHLRKRVLEEGLDSHLILLPEDSYHMTVIRGLNDQVRSDEFWPARLPKDLPMDEVDDYISAAVASAAMPGRIRMRFDCVKCGKSCMVARLLPADEKQEKILLDFRDAVADAIGLRLPGHDSYHFHISLGYTRIVPEGEDEVRLQRLLEEFNAYLKTQPPFETTPPYMAYYNDMMAFSPVRLPR
ncbi:MAG: DUF1868 domain-containing protein [Clostridia bacterium]|nr:DUF1868 domain-containing protein [Clostridia bacterium]